MRHIVITGTTRGLGAALVDEILSVPHTRVLALARHFTAAQQADPRITTRHCDLSDPATLPDAAEFRGRTRTSATSPPCVRRSR